MNLSVIKTLCETKNVKFKDLCNVIGITDAGLYKAINNNKISAEYLEKIADYFGVSVGVFFGKKTNANIKGVTARMFEHYVAILFYIAKYYSEQNGLVPALNKAFNNYKKEDKEFFYMSELVTKQWKLTEDDFNELQKMGAITHYQFVILKTWARCDYDILVFVKVYCGLYDNATIMELYKYFKEQPNSDKWETSIRKINDYGVAQLF